MLSLSPDRIALYSYAHLPAMFKPQRRIAEPDLPAAEAKLQILTLAIGPDARRLRVHRHGPFRAPRRRACARAVARLSAFQGYSTHADCDMLALGISAIGKVGPAYYQNVKTLKEYYERIDAGALPVVRGLELSPDDLLRRKVIHALACNFRVPTDGHGVDFADYFATELGELRKLAHGGLVEMTPEAIVVTPKGRLLIRSICMVFDRYLREKRERATYSKSSRSGAVRARLPSAVPARRALRRARRSALGAAVLRRLPPEHAVARARDAVRLCLRGDRRLPARRGARTGRPTPSGRCARRDRGPLGAGARGGTARCLLVPHRRGVRHRLLAWRIGRPILASKHRNWFFILLVLALGAASVAFQAYPQVALAAGLDVVLLVIAIMGGRVIPGFTNNAVIGAGARRNRWIEHGALGACC